MTKRILSVVLALVLVLAVAAPALAFELKVNDDADRTYVAYQIFTGEYVKDAMDVNSFVNAGVGSNLDAAALATELGVTTDPTEDSYATDLVEALADKFGSDGLATANFLQDYITGTPISLPSDVPVGYYLIVETTAGAESKSAFLLDVYTGTTINPKRSDVPVTDKSITDPDGSNPVNVSDNAIGDEIWFEISATVPENVDKYDPYTFVFHDTLGAGLTYQNNAVASGATAESTTFDAATGKLVVDFGDVSDVTPGTKITVKYSAILNKDAVVAEEGNLNEFTVEYTSAPGVDENGEPFTEETPKKYAVVFTFELTGDKFDDDTKAKLAEAKFVLKNEDGEYLKTIDAATGDIEWTTNKDDAQVLVSDSKGSFGVTGLDAGTYYLEETEAPAGYNKLTQDVKVTIVPSYDDVTKESEPVKLTNAASVNPTVEAPNNKGTVLPSTGGIGTTLFYVIGGLLMAAAVVMLVAKKRTVNE